MAVAFIMDFPGGTRAQYDQVVERMELGGTVAPGGLFHAAGSYEGGWRVIDAWESVEQFERFRDEKIIPLVTEAGLAPPQVRTLEVAELKPGSDAAPEFVQVVRLPGVDREAFVAADREILAAYGGRPPEAVCWHVDGPDGDGYCVIDAWSSKDARDQFLRDTVQPVVEPMLSSPPEIEELAVEATLASRTAAAV